MHVTIEIPDTLPQPRWQQRLQEFETSLRAEADFLLALTVSRTAPAIKANNAPQPSWLGCMAGTGTITGDLVAPTSPELVTWEVLTA